MRRDLFEAGSNEAAGSLAASYGRWSFARSVERIRYSWRGGRGRQRRKGSNAIVVKPGRSLLGSWADMVVVDLEGASLPARDAGSCACHIGWARRHGWRAGVMSCHTVALNVAAKDAAMNLRRPCGRRNKGRCRGAGR